jgi:hypothetical protein
MLKITAETVWENSFATMAKVKWRGRLTTVLMMMMMMMMMKALPVAIRDDNR